MTEDSRDGMAAAAAAYRDTNPDRKLLVFSGPMSGESVYTSIESLSNAPTESKKLSIFLTTRGGDPHAAYRLSHFASQRFDDVRLLLAGYCKSAGTLVAVGASEIGFDVFGELGPLDVQMTKPDEIFLQHSGLDVMQAIAQVTSGAYTAFQDYMLRLAVGGMSARTAAEIASNLAAKLYEPVAAQIDPVRLGEADRAIKIASEYGQRLDAGNLKPGALATLIHGYPTHGFVIDLDEAKKLFHHVSGLTTEEVAIANGLGTLVRSPALEPVVFDVLEMYAPVDNKGLDHSNETVNGDGGAVAEADSRESGDRAPTPAGGVERSNGNTAQTVVRDRHPT